MFSYFAKFFSRDLKKSNKATTRRDRTQMRLNVEELMPRVLPSANPFNMAWGHYADSATHPAFAAFVMGGESHGRGHDHGSEDTTFSATLTNSSGATGTALFNATTGNLTVSITKAAANTTLSVTVGTTTIGSFLTDASGNGKATFTEAAGAIAVGTTVAAGDVTGTFAQGDSAVDTPPEVGGGDCGHGEHGHGNPGATFSASLTNATGATGQALFNPTSGKLTVSVTKAAANTTLNVVVGGNTVGSVTTDASGNGRTTITELSSAIKAGTTVTVGDLSGTFAQFDFKAALTGATGLSGSADYNATKNVLSIHMTGATASTVYNVTVNGTVVGQVTTNKAGAGHLTIAPPSGATIASTSTVSIADTTGDPAILTGTFA
jgi:large repetitive protein